jgi:hypothetical protein
MNANPKPNLTLDLVVETDIPGGETTTLAVAVPDTPLSVADLIRAKAGAEWDAAARAGGPAAARESAPPIAGETPAPDSRGGAVRAALDAYRAGWYVIFVDGEPTPALDTRITPRTDTRIRFVRLYPG